MFYTRCQHLEFIAPSVNQRTLQINCRNKCISLRVPKSIGFNKANGGKIHRSAIYPQKLSQTRHGGDCERFNEFCRWFKNICRVDPQFLLKILWSGETHFRNCGMFNRHNEQPWMQDNPHHVKQRGINWNSGLMYDVPSVHGFLQNEFQDQDIPDELNLDTCATRQRFQDRATPHNMSEVWNYLNEVLPNSCSGRSGPIP